MPLFVDGDGDMVLGGVASSVRHTELDYGIVLCCCVYRSETDRQMLIERKYVTC